jgi:hypothetical protein
MISRRSSTTPIHHQLYQLVLHLKRGLFEGLPHTGTNDGYPSEASPFGGPISPLVLYRLYSLPQHPP